MQMMMVKPGDNVNDLDPIVTLTDLPCIWQTSPV